jgi:hypothetical protein
MRNHLESLDASATEQVMIVVRSHSKGTDAWTAGSRYTQGR